MEKKEVQKIRYGWVVLIVLLAIVAIAGLDRSQNNLLGYGVKRNSISAPTEVQLYFTPDTDAAGSAFRGTFYINNKANPLFEYTINLWAPCEPDFMEITEWNTDSRFSNRMVFSGVTEQNTRTGFYFIVPFTYNQCLYQWSIPAAQSKEANAIPLLRPKETLQITFTLRSSTEARSGTYSLDYGDQFGFAGKSAIRFSRK